MRRLGALLSAVLIGGVLLSLSTLLTVLMVEDGENLLAILFGVLGVALSIASFLWVAFLEGIFAGTDVKKISQGLLIAAAASPLTGAAWIGAGGRLGQAFLAGGVIAMSWSLSRVIGGLAGPPLPAGVPGSFALERRGWRTAPILRGTIEGWPASIEFSNAWNGEASETRNVACTLPHEAAGLEITPATVLGAISGNLQKTGDAMFDAGVHVRGPRSAVLALLRSPARDALLEMMRAGGTLSGGALRADARVPLALLARAAAALALPEAILPSLRANANGDAVDEVRLVTLEHLLSLDVPGARDEAIAACRLALKDVDPRLRVLGIAALRASPGDRLRADRALDKIARSGAVVAELLDRATGGPHESALLDLLHDERCGADAAPAVRRLLQRTERGRLTESAESVLARLERRAEDGRGQVSLVATEAGAGAVSVTEAGRVALAKKPTAQRE